MLECGGYMKDRQNTRDERENYGFHLHKPYECVRARGVKDP